MTSARYQELLGCLLEGELKPVEADELARELSESPALRQDLRQHLVLWDVWAQHQSPERSEAAFVQSWKTRLRSQEEDSDAFTRTVTPGIRADLRGEQGHKQPEPTLQDSKNPGTSTGNFLDWIVSLYSMVRSSTAMATASMAIIVFAIVFGISSWPAHATTLKGEAICTSCFLHESQEHTPAMRVMTGNNAQIVYLDRNKAVEGLQGRFCSGPAPAMAQGKSRTEGKRALFNAAKIEFPNVTAPSPTNKNDRILFPI